MTVARLCHRGAGEAELPFSPAMRTAPLLLVGLAILGISAPDRMDRAEPEA